MNRMQEWVASGSPWIWLSGGAVSLCLLIVFGLLGLIAFNGLGHFWPTDLAAIRYRDENGGRVVLLGEVVERGLKAQGAGGEEEPQLLIKLGNRDLYGLDFRWLNEAGIEAMESPSDAMVVERAEWGNLHGYLVGLTQEGKPLPSHRHLIEELRERLARRHSIWDDIRHIEKDGIGAVNHELERLRLEERRLQIDAVRERQPLAAIAEARAALHQQYDRLGQRLEEQYAAINRDSMVVRTAEGQQLTLPLAKAVRVYWPNAMGLQDKLWHYFGKLGEFVADEPREANTEGGIFPAIFGTVLMVFIMSLVVTPFGVVAAVYLREYAKQGLVTRTIRIAVNNLAGVPSVVFGVFGLGFFVYFVGGAIDRWFYPEALPAPTFGTPGLLWSSVTLALLTVPVVIVATEEGLARIPSTFREGSLALGATKAETLWRIVLPMASPAIMTGLILAVARAAGEVAPLMMVGVVKLAPSLPLDGNFPYLHLDRKFMHLGFHIYDVGFQSPNVEAARPLVFATAFLLVIVIVTLNLAAIRIRNRLRETHRATEI